MTPTFQASATVTSFVDSTVVAGTTYYYRVRAETSVAFSPWTNTANATVVNNLVVNSASWSNAIAYQLLSLRTSRLTANINQSNVNARVVITGGGINWTIFNGPIANVANTNFTFPAWNGTNPANGTQHVPFAGTYTFTLTVTKGGQTGTFTGKITIGNVYATFHGNAGAGVTKSSVIFLVGSTVRPYSVLINPVVTAATNGTFSMRVTGPGGYNRVPAGSPWTIGPAVGALPTGRLTGIAAIRTSGNYTFSVTPSVAASYTVTVLERHEEPEAALSGPHETRGPVPKGAGPSRRRGSPQRRRRMLVHPRQNPPLPRTDRRGIHCARQVAGGPRAGGPGPQRTIDSAVQRAEA